MLRREEDLSPQQRLALESLLGRTLQSGEEVYISASNPATIIPSSLTPPQRQQSIELLKKHFADIAAKSNPNVTPDEEDGILVEAMRSVRPDYRPVE